MTHLLVTAPHMEVEMEAQLNHCVFRPLFNDGSLTTSIVVMMQHMDGPLECALTNTQTTVNKTS